jgi:hypothetical protein
MLSRRIIAISPDKALAKQLAIALKAAGGSVETMQSLDPLGRGELQVALVVVHLAGELAGALAELLPRLTGDAAVIAVLPRANLASTVDIMQASDRVVGVLVAEELDSRQLSAMATRLLAGDLFGLDKTMAWGTKIHSTLVGDYQEKSLAIAQLGELAEQMGVRRKYREAIEQSVDEMLMNALYDAPVDEQGQPIFSDIPTKTRISLRVEQKVVVQYACDGHIFAVSVRDAFGTLERSTVLRYLYKCLHSEQQFDRKTGSAGLGLYLMASTSSPLGFNVLPGVATEVVTVCKLDSPKIQLEELGFFTERIDAGGRLAAGPSRRLPAGASYPVERRGGAAAPATSKLVVAVLSLAILAILGLIAIVAWPRLFGPGKTSVTFTTDPAGATIAIDGRARGIAGAGTLTLDGLTIGKAYVVSASLDGYEPIQTVVEPTESTPPVPLVLRPLAAVIAIESDPPGATITVDGVELGQTPHQVTTLAPRSRVELRLHRDGFVDAVQALEVPAPGKDARVVVPLALSADFASVLVTSEPAGAKVYKNGELLAGAVTPTEEIIVEAGRATVFTLALADHVAGVIEARPDRGARRVTVATTLVKGTPIAVKANVDGRATVDGVPGCRRQAVPFDCIAPPGTYTIAFEGDAGARGIRKVELKAAPVAATFGFGFIEAKRGRKFKLSSNGATMTRAALEAGKRTVLVVDEGGGGTSSHTVTVATGKTITVP